MGEFVNGNWSNGNWSFEQISKSTHPCVICGKNDFCYRRYHSDGNAEHCCHRTSSKSDVMGVDGNIYLWKKEITPTTGVIEVFESEEDRRIRKGNLAGAGSTRPLSPQFRYAPVNGPIEGEIEVASIEERNAFNLALKGVMHLDVKHQNALKKDWNVMDEHLFEKIISKYPILTCPPTDYVYSRFSYKGEKSSPSRTQIATKMAERFGDITKFPGFCKNAKGQLTIISPEGMWFPIYDKDGNLSTYRVRCDYPDIKGEFEGKEGVFSHSYDKNGQEITQFYPAGESTPRVVDVKWPPKGKSQGKYKNLSSVFEKREGSTIKNGYGNGSRLGSQLSLYTQPSDKMDLVFITEGEKKAMVANVLLGRPCVSVPGVSCFMKLFEKGTDGESMMDSLIRRGAKMFVVCYDADKSANIYVLNAQDGLANTLKESSIKAAIGEWDANWGKGLDDVLIQGVMPTIYPIA